MCLEAPGYGQVPLGHGSQDRPAHAVWPPFGLARVPAGRLGDRFAYGGLFIAGLIVFTLAGLGCGLAGPRVSSSPPEWLRAWGAGIYYLAVSATTQRLSPGRARSQVFGFLGATAGISTAVGPLIGGALIQLGGTQDGWRWVFLVNLFIGVTEVAAALRLLPQRHQAEPHELDPACCTLQAATVVNLGLVSAALLCSLGLPRLHSSERATENA